MSQINEKKLVAFVAILLTSTIFLYQNCAPSFKSTNSSALQSQSGPSSGSGNSQGQPLSPDDPAVTGGNPTGGVSANLNL
jgi:hypothetical protein